MRHHHSIERTRGRRRRCVQIRVAVHVNHADVAEVAARPCNSSQRHRTIAAQDQRQRRGLYGLLDARLQRFHSGKYAANVSRAGAFFVGLVNLGGIITKVGYFVADRAEPVGQPRCAKRCGGTLAARRHCCGAGRRAQEHNLIRLADDFDRHSFAPWCCFSKSWPENDSARDGTLAGRKFRRKREAHVFANQIQVALIRKSKL